MEIYNFSKNIGKKITKFDSDFVISRIIQSGEMQTNVGCMYLEENGIIGFHQAVVPQLLLVLNGEGYVRGEKEEYAKVQLGDAVFWEKDEWHETKTDTGLNAIVIESEQLNPSSFMPLKK
ncbi:cupin [Lysinibacillus sp. M3]|uniref:Cupin n=1 Tax=Lysinibacillus zambalensis TaxID=3160866 RepID=A0ABV1MM97_9BACI